jgi:thioredoxin 1
MAEAPRSASAAARDIAHFTISSDARSSYDNEMIAPPPPKSDPIGTVTSETFEQLVLQGKGPIAVEFMSYGCAHCRAIEPILRQAAEKIGAKEHLYRVSVAADAELASSYQIEGTPTFGMFLDSREVGRVVGPHPVLSTIVDAVTRPFES